MPPPPLSAPRSAAVLSVDEAIARGAKAASLATSDAPTMPPALDLKTRGASVHDIARRLGELQSVSPESQLDMARKMETSCFDAAKSVEDYRKKIDKRLAKAAKVLAAAKPAGAAKPRAASPPPPAPRPAPPAAPQKRAASPAPPRATPTPPPRAPTPGSGPPAAKRARPPEPPAAAAAKKPRVDAAGGEGLAAYRAEMLAAHGPVLRWWSGGAAAALSPSLARLRAVETGGAKLAAWLAGVDKTLADHATVARNVLDGLERAARKPGESDAACLGRLRATIPLWCDKLGQRKATLDAQLGACLERYAPKTLADVDVAAEVEKRLEDGDGVLELPRALPAVASLSLHRCGDYVATVPCDGFKAAVFLDRSGPDRSVVDVVVKALEISEAAPASRHALWRRVTADVDAAVPDLLRATPPGPRREPRLVAAVLAAVAQAKAARLKTAAEDDGPPRDLSGPRPPIPAGAPEECVPS